MTASNVYITGDTHNYIDVHKLASKRFPQGKSLSKSDYVIVAGDFGFVWDGDKSDRYWLNWFDVKKFSTLFVDGNHENFDLLNQYPIELWNKGEIHRITGSVLHLRRGQVFEIGGHSIFTFGGAKSSDIEERIEHVSWWEEEEPSQAEYDVGIRNLEKCGWQVDYVITHTCSSRTLSAMNGIFGLHKEASEINEYFDFIEQKLQYRHWYFGHYHRDYVLAPDHTAIFQQVVEI